MKERKKNYMKRLGGTGIAVLALLLLLFGVQKAFIPSVPKYLKGLSSEIVQCPAYAVFSTVHTEAGKLNLQQLLLEHGVENAGVKEVLAIVEERVWFVFQQEGEEPDSIDWTIASAGKDGSHLEIHHREPFSTENGPIGYRCGNNLRGDFYQEKNGFYHDGKIVLTDHERLMEYDIETGTARNMQASDYTFPAWDVDVTAGNEMELRLERNGEEFLISPAAMSQTSAVHRDLMKTYRTAKTWNGDSVLEDYYYGVQTDGEDLFVVCNLMSWSGETYALVYTLDLARRDFAFCFSQYMGDRIHDGELYIIPQYEEMD